MKKICIALTAMVLSFTVQAQKKIVLMGSSTAQGVGASIPSLSMFGRLQAYYNTHTWYNLGLSGMNTYEALAASVPGKPAIRPASNITAALGYDPDIIIVSYPSNDVNNGYTNEETIANLTLLYNIATTNGVTIFFLGTQPRDFVDEARRTQLSTQNDLILQTFIGKSINVYPLVVRTGGYIATDVAVGDGIHLDDEGHRRLFQEVVNFNIFSTVLPIVIEEFKGEIQYKSALLRWKSKADDQHDFVAVEKSTDGQQFTEIGRVKPKSRGASFEQYQFTDMDPAVGKNYYRLALVDKNGRKEFTKTVQLSNLTPGSLSAYPVPATDVLYLKTVQSTKSSVTITITDLTGRTLYNSTRTGDKGVNTFTIPVSQISKGMYLVRISSPDDTNTLRFIKQ
jgi:lysophospholipase L1-like esterase